MSALREAAESGAFPSDQRAVNKRVDALLLGLEDVFKKLQALAIMDDSTATDQQRHEAVLTFSDWEAAKGIYDAAARLRGHSDERVAEFLAEMERKKKSEPFISTDRRPRRRRTLVDGKTTTTGEVLDRLGDVIGHDDGLVM